MTFTRYVILPVTLHSRCSTYGFCSTHRLITHVYFADFAASFPDDRFGPLHILFVEFALTVVYHDLIGYRTTLPTFYICVLVLVPGYRFPAPTVVTTHYTIATTTILHHRYLLLLHVAFVTNSRCSLPRTTSRFTLPLTFCTLLLPVITVLRCRFIHIAWNTVFHLR